MIRVDAIWLALGVSDLRGGIDVLLGQVVRGFAGGAQPQHSAYVFANRRLKFQLRLGHHRRPDNTGALHWGRFSPVRAGARIG